MNTVVRLMTLIFLLLSGPSGLASEKITIMVGGIEKQIYLPAMLAERLGYLKETGLEIELLSTSAGSSAEREMLSGVAHGVIGFYDRTINLQARGKLVQSVVQFSQAPGEVLLVAKEEAGQIKSPADFRGKTLGVTGLGSATHFLVQYLTAAAGVKSGEFSVVPVGAGDSFISAMTLGRISAGMTTEPTISRLLALEAAEVLVDLRTPGNTEAVLGGVYPGACLYMPSAWVSKHPEKVQKIVTAFVRTLRWIDRHSAREIADLMPEAYYMGNKEMYVKALEAGKSMFTPQGEMPENGPRTVLRILKEFDKNVREKPINLRNTYTNEFVRATNRPQ